MFTIEVRINGSLISHVYGRNTGTTPDKGDAYEYELYTPESRAVVKGVVHHRREEGINALAGKILTKHRKSKP